MSYRILRRCLRLETLDARDLPSLTPVGVDFSINDYTPGYQRASDTTVDANGNFMVAWFDFNAPLYPETGAGITVKKYDPQGNVIWGPVAVSEAGGALDSPPSIASNAAGASIVVWSRISLGDTDNNVYGRRFDSAGQPLGATILVNEQPINTTMTVLGYPDVAMDAAGDFVVTWTVTPGVAHTQRTQARRFSANGAPTGSEFSLNSVPGSVEYSTISMADDGSFAATWQLDGGGPRFRRFAADGTPFAPEIALNSTIINSHPVVRLTPSGTGVIAWRTATGMTLQSVAADGTFGTTLPMAVFASTGPLPLAINAYGGGLVIGRVVESGIYYLVAQPFTSVLVVDGDVFHVTESKNAGYPSAAVDQDGDAMIVWAYKPPVGGSYDLFSHRYIGAAPRVLNNIINSGSTNRSEVKDVKLDTSRVLTLPTNSSDAFELKNLAGTAFPVAVDTSASTPAGTRMKFTFPGGLPDGRFTFRIKANMIHDTQGQPFDGDGNGIAGDDYVTSFLKLTGDFNGDGKADNRDFVLFRHALAINDLSFDLDGDGDLDLVDFLVFRGNYGAII